MRRPCPSTSRGAPTPSSAPGLPPRPATSTRWLTPATRRRSAWTTCSTHGRGRGAATRRWSSPAPTGSAPADGVKVAGRLAPADYRALLRRARVFVAAPRREDYGIAPLEALADGCMLVTTPAPGPYPALDIARQLDPGWWARISCRRCARHSTSRRRCYAARAAELVAPFSRQAVDQTVAQEVLPRLLTTLRSAVTFGLHPQPVRRAASTSGRWTSTSTGSCTYWRCAPRSLITRRRWRAAGGDPELVYEVAMWGFPAGPDRRPDLLPDHHSRARSPTTGGGRLRSGRADSGSGAGSPRRRGRAVPCSTAGSTPTTSGASWMPPRPSLLVAQSFGRIGNYFNQELFGGPTTLPWGLKIDAAHRPPGLHAVRDVPSHVPVRDRLEPVAGRRSWCGSGTTAGSARRACSPCTWPATRASGSSRRRYASTTPTTSSGCG